MFSPIGISDSNPAISWNLSDGIKQTTYRIQAYDEESNILGQWKVDSELFTPNGLRTSSAAYTGEVNAESMG